MGRKAREELSSECEEEAATTLVRALQGERKRPSRMNEHEFERALERGFADMRARRGLCPPAEKLAAFASGEIPEREAASIRAHVALCGACDGMLVRLREFEEAKAGDLPV